MRDHNFEPGLPKALAALSQRQRLAVVLVHGYGYTLREVAELTGIRATTVQNHLNQDWLGCASCWELTMKTDLGEQIHELMEHGLRPVSMADIKTRAPVRVGTLRRVMALFKTR